MRYILAIVGSVGLASGCVAQTSESGPEGDVGVAASKQIDPGLRTGFTQGGTLVAYAWRGTISNGSNPEYWAVLSGYSANATRTYSTTSRSCADFKSDVCNGGWSSASYYEGVYTQTTLNCALPPGPCSPPSGGVALLGAGTWQLADGNGSNYGTTYVSGACEYWSMDSNVLARSVQTKSVFGYASLSAFETAMCNQNPVHSLWYSASYKPLSDFCSGSYC